MTALVDDPEVGGVLAAYVPAEAIRTYIKDSILNQYSKTRRRPPSDLAPFVATAFGQACASVDGDCAGEAVQLFVLDSGDMVVAGAASRLKWETGIRKVLEFVAAAPGLPPTDGRELLYMLVIVTGGAHVLRSERLHLATILGQLGWTCVFSDESTSPHSAS